MDKILRLPNLSCRYFTHSTEFVLWARKSEKSKHYYNYDLMRRINGGTQMKDVWRFPAIAPWEKSCGKHPTQKPLSLLTRIILASTEKGDLVLDPFSGSATTGIACALTGRRYIGIEKESDFLEISKNRFAEIQNNTTANSYRVRITDLKNENQLDLFSEN
ncbi:MAG: site-specific DNA-methyltransferase [Treponemataceae bacterium]|nr:site-specific DNA-methyltransferase [Treponemataceae bacterium]